MVTQPDNAHARILGIESSCDETAAAVVVDGRTILSSVVASQIDIHRKYGGVVPELAAVLRPALLARRPLQAAAEPASAAVLGAALTGNS